jgi:hypothetical protein
MVLASFLAGVLAAPILEIYDQASRQPMSLGFVLARSPVWRQFLDRDVLSGENVAGIRSVKPVQLPGHQGGVLR